jgi:hypothetical protein
MSRSSASNVGEAALALGALEAEALGLLST